MILKAAAAACCLPLPLTMVGVADQLLCCCVEVWDCCVKQPGLLGDCEEIRELISEYGPTRLEANRLYWITDRTPHESLPLAQDTYRQFFRLVTEKVDVWYEQHSTPNPLGVVPPAGVKIITESKFHTGLK